MLNTIYEKLLKIKFSRYSRKLLLFELFCTSFKSNIDNTVAVHEEKSNELLREHYIQKTIVINRDFCWVLTFYPFLMLIIKSLTEISSLILILPQVREIRKTENCC